MTSRPTLRHASAWLLFAIGVAASLHFGRRGFMPLDQSIVFDGGWRVLSGQVPFRDYVAPNGIVVHALQAGFFSVLGVTWLAYCLHAALVNGLFAVLVARILTALGLEAPFAFVYGALSALVLYPPIGVPYMDPHAFFFSLLAVGMAVRASRDGRPTRTGTALWLGVPPVLVLAGLAKQIPSAWVVPIVLVIALRARRDERRRRIVLLAASALTSVGLLFLWAVAAGVRLDLVETYGLRLPAEEAVRRVAQHPGVSGMAGLLWAKTGELGLWSIGVVQVLLALGLGALVAGRTAADGARLGALGPAIRRVLLAGALLLVCLGFVGVTLNQPALGVPYVFLAMGLVHDALRSVARGWPGGSGVPRWARLLGVLVLAVALRDGLHFAATFDASRLVDDIAWDPEVAAANAPVLPPALGFLGWQTSPYVPYTAADLRDLVELLEARNEHFLLIGDASILYGLTGMPSVSPSLWFHRGLTIPIGDDPAFPAWEQMLLERFDALDVRLVVLEGRHTWNGTALAHLPRLARIVRQRVTGLVRLGGFTVVELAPDGVPRSSRPQSPPAP